MGLSLPIWAVTSKMWAVTKAKLAVMVSYTDKQLVKMTLSLAE